MPNEYLVQVQVHLPADMDSKRREQLLAAELARGRELLNAGTIQRIWRIPGALANVGIWRATNATELHEQIASLPLFPFIDAVVTALAEHPVESSR